MTKVTKEGIETQSGKKILSSLVVWAAGIKAPEFLSQIKGKTNSIHRVKVESTLQSTSDGYFALATAQHAS